MSLITKNKLWALLATVSFHILLLIILAIEGKQQIAQSEEITQEMFIPLEDLEDILNSKPEDLSNKNGEEQVNPKTAEAKPQKIAVEQPPLPDRLSMAEVEEPIPLPEKKETLQTLLPPPTPAPDTIANDLKMVIHKSDSAKQKQAKYFADREFYKKNYKTIYNLKKVYAFAKMAQEMKEKLDSQLVNITNKAEKRKAIKEMEKQVFAKFETAARNMSTSQGRLLLKLISRQTGQTGYDIVHDYKGALPAAFWQGVALLFRQNLKSQFDSTNEDALLEQIVKKYERKEIQ